MIFDLGVELEVESPSHDVRIEHGSGRSDGRVRATFAQHDVALDCDVVVTAVPRCRAAAPRKPRPSPRWSRIAPA